VAVDSLPAESRLEGFANGSDGLGVPPLLMDKYHTVAEEIASEAVRRSGSLLPCGIGDLGAGGCLRDFLRGFGLRVWRRPLTEVGVKALVNEERSTRSFDHTTGEDLLDPCADEVPPEVRAARGGRGVGSRDRGGDRAVATRNPGDPAVVAGRPGGRGSLFPKEGAQAVSNRVGEQRAHLLSIEGDAERRSTGVAFLRPQDPSQQRLGRRLVGDGPAAVEIVVLLLRRAEHGEADAGGTSHLAGTLLHHP